jgi:hypothetical protein
MYHFFRTLLIVIVWISLLIVVPYAFLESICYWGICGGPEVDEIRTHPHYISILSYYIWLYPLVVFAALFFSRRKSRQHVQSLLLVLVPIICLIPYLYVKFQIGKIQTNYVQIHAAVYSVHADDYVCSSGKFFRYHPSASEKFLFFNIDKTGSSVAFFYSFKELENYLRKYNMDPERCKNQSGASLASFLRSKG